jgi:hypothetical protein
LQRGFPDAHPVPALLIAPILPSGKSSKVPSIQPPPSKNGLSEGKFLVVMLQSLVSMQLMLVKDGAARVGELSGLTNIQPELNARSR